MARQSYEEWKVIADQKIEEFEKLLGTCATVEDLAKLWKAFLNDCGHKMMGRALLEHYGLRNGSVQD